jgi:hypothetical protein
MAAPLYFDPRTGKYKVAGTSSRSNRGLWLFLGAIALVIFLISLAVSPSHFQTRSYYDVDGVLDHGPARRAASYKLPENHVLRAIAIRRGHDDADLRSAYKGSNG